MAHSHAHKNTHAHALFGHAPRYRKRHKHIDEQVLKRWAWQILQGLVYLVSGVGVSLLL